MVGATNANGVPAPSVFTTSYVHDLVLAETLPCDTSSLYTLSLNGKNKDGNTSHYYTSHYIVHVMEKPTGQPTPAPTTSRPTPKPTAEAAPAAPSPTTSPSTRPTADDTVRVSVELSISANAAPTNADKITLKTTIASIISVDVSNIYNFAVTSTASTTRRRRRRLSAGTRPKSRYLATAYTWSVTFDVVVSLSALTDDSISSAADLSSSVSKSLDKNLEESLSTAGLDVSVESVDSSTPNDDSTDDDGASSAAIFIGGVVGGSMVLCVAIMGVMVHRKSKLCVDMNHFIFAYIGGGIAGLACCCYYGFQCTFQGCLSQLCRCGKKRDLNLFDLDESDSDSDDEVLRKMVLVSGGTFVPGYEMENDVERQVPLSPAYSHTDEEHQVPVLAFAMPCASDEHHKEYEATALRAFQLSAQKEAKNGASLNLSQEADREEEEKEAAGEADAGTVESQPMPTMKLRRKTSSSEKGKKGKKGKQKNVTMMPPSDSPPPAPASRRQTYGEIHSKRRASSRASRGGSSAIIGDLIKESGMDQPVADIVKREKRRRSSESAAAATAAAMTAATTAATAAEEQQSEDDKSKEV